MAKNKLTAEQMARIRDRFETRVKELNQHKDEIYSLVPKGKKAELFDKAYQRASNADDPLFFSNRGRFYELFFKIIIGEFQDKNDIDNADFTENTPHTKGGDAYSQGGMAFQIKGPGSSINIYKPRDLVIKNETLDPQKSLRRVLNTYHKLGNNGAIWRYGVGFGPQAYSSMLDIGQQTMLSYAEHNGKAFSFEKNKNVNVDIFLAYLRDQGITKPTEVIKYLKQAKRTIARGSGKDFQILADLASAAGRKTIFSEEAIDKVILGILLRDYTLRFNPGPEFAKTMVSEYGAILRTSIGRDENHTRFYEALYRLGIQRTTTYPGRAGNYLSAGGRFKNTQMNKSKDYYYDVSYFNPLY